MITKQEKSVEIRLPQWYACWSASSDQDIAAALPHPSTSERYGPITVVNNNAYLDVILFGEDGRNVAIFEGFILDEQSLYNEFEVEACPLNGAQCVALAYQRWGQDVFDHLTGGYLAAIWDEQNGVFLLGHDESSKHPVYYAQHEGLLWFASNVLSLAHADVVPRQPNMLSLYRRLLLYWPERQKPSLNIFRAFVQAIIWPKRLAGACAKSSIGSHILMRMNPSSLNRECWRNLMLFSSKP